MTYLVVLSKAVNVGAFYDIRKSIECRPTSGAKASRVQTTMIKREQIRSGKYGKMIKWVNNIVVLEQSAGKKRDNSRSQRGAMRKFWDSKQFISSQPGQWAQDIIAKHQEVGSREASKLPRNTKG